MFKQCKTLLTLLLLSSLMPLLAQSDDSGNTGFDTLKLVYNAKTMSMGGAVIGLAENAGSLTFNPAAILRAPNSTLAATVMNHFVGSGGGSIDYVYPKDIFMAYGASLRYWNSGSMDRTEISPSGELIETGDTFGSQSLIASASMARYISSAIDLGGSLKFIFDSVDDANATAVMVDVGVLHHTVNEKVKVGLSVRNIGFQSSYYTENKYKEGLPMTFGVGLSMQMREDLVAAMDVGKAGGEKVMARFGLEYYLYPSLALRAGFKSNAADYHMGSFMGYLGGGSLGLGWKTGKFGLDYAIASYGDLGLINQITVNYNFNK
ncbi:MAG: PorV/PorQ family protein [Candidatus Cloacimonetes bacterium]|nr:PorV/PorQ family protein [Candidatus Cloacimonadota bacterium]